MVEEEIESESVQIKKLDTSLNSDSKIEIPKASRQVINIKEDEIEISVKEAPSSPDILPSSKATTTSSKPIVKKVIPKSLVSNYTQAATSTKIPDQIPYEKEASVEIKNTVTDIHNANKREETKEEEHQRINKENSNAHNKYANREADQKALLTTTLQDKYEQELLNSKHNN